MPIQTTNFPSKHFDEQFAQACSDVREYFREAWSIAKRVAAHIKSKSRPKGSKRGKGKGRISMGKVIVEVMHEDNAKPSSVYDARKCGATFDEAEVERILALCKDAGTYRNPRSEGASPLRLVLSQLSSRWSIPHAAPILFPQVRVPQVGQRSKSTPAIPAG